MKTSYQQFGSILKKSCKMIADKMGGDYDSAANKIFDLMEKERPDELISLGIQHLVNHGECLHLFVSDEQFLNWLIDCCPTLRDGSPEAMEEMTRGKVCVLHFKTSSTYRCFAFKLYKPCVENKNRAAIVITFSDNGDLVTGGDKTPWGCIHFSEPDAVPLGEMFMRHALLINGLGMYLSCFPEMLIDGAPDDVKHPSHHQYSTVKTIGVSPKVKMDERGEVTPHFRRGHFRVLRSDKFTTKRFQVVFVRQCFVKGEAATIISPEEQ